MPLPFLWISIAFSSGIMFENYFAQLWIIACWILLITIPGMVLTSCRKSFFWLMIPTYFALGILMAHCDGINPESSVDHFHHHKISLQGIVTSHPKIQIKGRKQTISLVMDCKSVAISKPRNNLTRYQRRNIQKVTGTIQVFLFQSNVEPVLGDEIRVFGMLEPPKRAMNPGEFDYQRYLKSQQIQSVLRAFGKNNVRIISRGQYSRFFLEVGKIQKMIENQIKRLYADDSEVLLNALILGNRKNLSTQMRSDFMKTGTSHLLAISGLNIMLVAGTCYWLILTLRVGQKTAALASLILACAYVLISGWGVTVQRAGWMAGGTFLALLFEREKSSLNIFSFAFWIMLMTHTQNIFNVSFQLSFLSVFALMIVFPRIRREGFYIEGILESIAATLGTLPVVLYYFNTLSIVSLAANILAIPLSHLAVLFGMLSLIVSPIESFGHFLAIPTQFWIHLWLRWTELWAGFEWGYWFVPRPGPGYIGAYYIFLGGAILAMRLKSRIKRAAMFLTGIAIFSCVGFAVTAAFFFKSNDPKEYAMTFLSVGKNEVAHLRVGKDHWLINAGRDKPSDQVEWIVGPYLKSQGVKRLAGIIWTDELKKHTSGARTLARDFKWYWDIQPNGLKNAEIYKTKSREKIYLNDDDCFSLNQKIRICRRGDFDGKTFWLDIQMGKNQVWFFPADHPQTMQKLRAEIKKRDIDYLYVPEKMLKRDELYEFINPKVIISSSMSKASVDALVARDIEFIDLQLTGAVSLIPYGPNRMVGDFFLD